MVVIVGRAVGRQTHLQAAGATDNARLADPREVHPSEVAHAAIPIDKMAAVSADSAETSRGRSRRPPEKPEAMFDTKMTNFGKDEFRAPGKRSPEVLRQPHRSPSDDSIGPLDAVGIGTIILADSREILKIARRTTDIIDNYITSNVCLFGSAASYLWADIGRVPNDEDEFLDPEEVKRSIVDADDRYYLEPSKKRGETYDKLYCRLPGWKTDSRRCVKIDIVVPPDVGLPEINSYDYDWIDGIPVMPLFELLVMKTQGWLDHRTSFRRDYRAEEGADVTDIVALLDRAVEEKVSYQDVSAFRQTSEFMNYALTLAREFVHVNGRFRKWKRLGFPL
ncbi:hypothetical protein BJY52DRAFT_1227926 [Lactarius psammicola]|nr:hypothetical protein BJY52DRAFT_1227926 [Lactarius psammicola]